MKNSRFKENLPEPTLNDPFKQVEYVWRGYSERSGNKLSRQATMGSFLYYEKYLAQPSSFGERSEEDPRFFLKDHWHNYSVCAAERYWRSVGYSSATINGLVNCLTNVINFAAERGMTTVDNLICPKVKVHRESKNRRAYTDNELDIIRRIIKDGFNKISELVLQYERKGVGSDPRKASRKKRKRRDSASDWADWDNMVWYFENVMNCQVLTREQVKGRKLKDGLYSFFGAASAHHGGIKKVWDKLRVPSLISYKIIIPLIVKLAMETGLNPSSILNLKRDCLQESHPLTGLPYIRYYKERSTGEKDLHLALFDEENQAHLQLLPKQSEIIRRTVNLLLKLTQPLVPLAKDEDKDFLLLMQLEKPKQSWKSNVKRVEGGDLHYWSKTVRNALKEFEPENTLEFLNVMNFRPTKITQLVRQGHDFFRVQAIAGHASIQTTLHYVEKHQIMPLAKRRVNETLNQIHKNTREFLKSPKPYATAESLEKSGFIYKGVLADCKDVYDPPKSIRQMKDYKSSQSCTHWNMCLFCPNVIITKRHLPVLIGYANSIKMSREAGNLSQVPNNVHYEKVSEILKEIFKEFPEEDLVWASGVAECAEFYVDGLVFRGVKSDESIAGQ